MICQTGVNKSLPTIFAPAHRFPQRQKVLRRKLRQAPENSKNLLVKNGNTEGVVETTFQQWVRWSRDRFPISAIHVFMHFSLQRRTDKSNHGSQVVQIPREEPATKLAVEFYVSLPNQGKHPLVPSDIVEQG